MDIDELIARYLDAWDRADVSALMKLMHPQGSYFDAFWVEQCSGPHLAKYFADNFATENRRYEVSEAPLVTANGFIIRYVAYKKHDVNGEVPLFNGAEIVTTGDGLVLTISDIYCDPDPQELMELAQAMEGHHGQAHVAEDGLGARVAARIKNKLDDLAESSSVYLDPMLTVTMLADRVGCSVMHLFHVLETEKKTTFLQFVNECRVRHSTSLLTESGGEEPDLQQIAEECGFESTDDYIDAFQTTFSMAPAEYAGQFSGTADAKNGAS